MLILSEGFIQRKLHDERFYFKKSIIQCIVNAEKTPEMFRSPKEIEATIHTFYSLILENIEYDNYYNIRNRVTKELLGKKGKLNKPFSYQISEKDIELMATYLKRIREELGILEEAVDNPK